VNRGVNLRVLASALGLTMAVVGFSQKSVSTTVSVVTQIRLDPTAAPLGETAEVDWTRGLIIAEGKGTASGKLTMAQARLRARGAAIADAYRVLAAAVGGVRVDAETTVRNYELESDVVRTNISALIRGATILDEKLETLPDGSYIYTVRMGLSLYGPQGLSRIIYPEIASKKPQPTQLEKTEKSDHRTAETQRPATTQPEGAEATSDEYRSSHVPSKPQKSPATEGGTPTVQKPAPYTGLIVDATGLPIMPSMAPKILSEDGTEVYGTVEVSSKYANDVGIASFFKTLDEALMYMERVGENPLVVRAKNVTEPYPTGVIVGARDAELIRAENARSGFLDKLRVAIVSDKIF